MKKIILLLCMCFLLIACDVPTKNSGIVDLGVYEVVDVINSQKQDNFLLYITSDKCYSCEEYEKVITKLQKEYGFTIYRLKMNVDEKNNDVKKAFSELEVSCGRVEVLPMTYYFSQGVVLPENKKAGYVEEEDMVVWLKNINLIK